MALNGSAHPTVLLSCWDWTFAYNMFTIQESEHYYYVSIVGSTLNGQDRANPKPFVLSNSFDEYSIGQDFTSRFPIVTAYAKDKCSWEASDKTFSCVSGQREFPWNESIYLDRLLDNLGTPVSVISTYPAAQLVVEASEDSFTFSRISEYEGEVTKDTLAVAGHSSGSGLQCGLDPYSNGNSFLNARVPEALVRHLEQ